ncbi:uncharacterized protein [Cherax quadricarinatus]|uniref:uncharacterized protein n=1 Tax=Cherax quadricarinatus TaxID=27406 RepID=UPI00387E51A4
MAKQEWSNSEGSDKQVEVTSGSAFILEAITALKERNGSTRRCILRYLNEAYELNERARNHLQKAFQNCLASGLIEQCKDDRAASLYKINAQKAAVESSTQKAAAESSTRKAAAESSTRKAAAESSTRKAAAESSTRKAAAESSTRKAAAESSTRKAAAESSTRKAAAESSTRKAAAESSTRKAAAESSTRKAPAENSTRKVAANKASTRKPARKPTAAKDSTGMPVGEEQEVTLRRSSRKKNLKGKPTESPVAEKDTTRKPREKVAVGENRSENPNEEAEGSTTKKICNHPSYSQMITAAIRSLDESKGSSRQAILKYILSTFAVNEKMVKINLNVALKRDVLSGDLVQVTGKGASGSFRLKRSKTEPEGSKAGPKCSKVKHESSKTKPESSKDKPRHLKKSGKSRGLNSSTRERTSCTYVH